MKFATQIGILGPYRKAILSPLMTYKRSFVSPLQNCTFKRAYGQMGFQNICRGDMLFIEKKLRDTRSLSTATPPPPPPPPPPFTEANKNRKGVIILDRISRAFTFSFSSILVVGASGIALLVLYLIFSELFLPSGDTKTFNKTVRMVQDSKLAQEALGFAPGERLRAYGEVVGDKWVRNRPAQTMRKRGTDGKDYLVMKFHVEANSGKHGSVTIEQVDYSFWTTEILYCALDIPGKKRIYIKEPKFKPSKYVPKGSGFSSKGGFLGLNWGPKKDE